MTGRRLVHGYYWWCGRTDAHTHTEQINGPHLVDGRPAGPAAWHGLRAEAGWLDEASHLDCALADARADARMADARARAEAIGVWLRHPQLTHQPTAVPGPPPGWTGCGSPEATVARIAHPPAWPRREPLSAVTRALREVILAAALAGDRW